MLKYLNFLNAVSGKYLYCVVMATPDRLIFIHSLFTNQLAKHSGEILSMFRSND